MGIGFLFSAACGSEVNGSGGSGAGSTSSSSSSSGEPVTAVQACNDACHKLETMNCTLGSDCPMQCDDYLANLPPECQDEAAAYFNCTLLNAKTCDEPMECKTPENAMETCVAMFGCVPDSTCFGGQGMNGEMSCGCDATCKGTKYSTNCTTPAGGGASKCDCLVDDKSVGTCQSTDLGGCGPKDTCCNEQYFKL